MWKMTICRTFTAQKTNFSIKDFFSKFGQIRNSLRIWSLLRKISLMERFIFSAVILHNIGQCSMFTLRHITMHKKWSFPLKISSVNVTKSAYLITFTIQKCYISWPSEKNLCIHIARMCKNKFCVNKIKPN